MGKKNTKDGVTSTAKLTRDSDQTLKTLASQTRQVVLEAAP